LPGTPVKIVYRSKKISIPLLAAMEASNAWGDAGLEVERLDYVSGAAKSDPMLHDGEVDFIFGSHISPYIHRANGVPMVYLGQSVNWTTDHLVTREPVADLASLRGKVFAEEKVKQSSHPWGNHKLYLQRGGIDLTEVDFVGADSDERGRKAWQLVADGVADAALVMPPNDTLAREAGLVVTNLAFLPMVQATTLTTMLDTRRNRPELCLQVIQAVRQGISFYKNEPEKMMALMETEVADALDVHSDLALRTLYENNRMLLQEDLYPRAEAILNAYRIAVLQDPTIQQKVNPLELWDLSLLR
jgi:ABC-type nitrate/sulfonate/bicarbonate transport system substrate-binding protein